MFCHVALSQQPPLRLHNPFSRTCFPETGHLTVVVVRLWRLTPGPSRLSHDKSLHPASLPDVSHSYILYIWPSCMKQKSFVFFLFCFFSNLNKSDSYPGSCVMSWKFPSSPAATCAAFLCILFLNNKPVTHSTIKSVNGFESSEACYFSKNRWESCMKTSISNSDAKV